MTSVQHTGPNVAADRMKHAVDKLEKLHTQHVGTAKTAIIAWMWFSLKYELLLAVSDVSVDSPQPQTQLPSINIGAWAHEVMRRVLRTLAHVASPPQKLAHSASSSNSDANFWKHTFGGILSTHHVLLQKLGIPDPSDRSKWATLLMCMAAVQTTITMREMFAPVWINARVKPNTTQTDLYAQHLRTHNNITPSVCSAITKEVLDRFKQLTSDLPEDMTAFYRDCEERAIAELAQGQQIVGPREVVRYFVKIRGNPASSYWRKDLVANDKDNEEEEAEEEEAAGATASPKAADGDDDVAMQDAPRDTAGPSMFDIEASI